MDASDGGFRQPDQDRLRILDPLGVQSGRGNNPTDVDEYNKNVKWAKEAFPEEQQGRFEQ